MWIKSPLSSTFHSFNHQGSTEMDAQNHDGPRCGLQKSSVPKKGTGNRGKSMALSPFLKHGKNIWDKTDTDVFFLEKYGDIPCEDRKSPHQMEENVAEKKVWKKMGQSTIDMCIENGGFFSSLHELATFWFTGGYGFELRLNNMVWISWIWWYYMDSYGDISKFTWL